MSPNDIEAIVDVDEMFQNDAVSQLFITEFLHIFCSIEE